MNHTGVQSTGSRRHALRKRSFIVAHSSRVVKNYSSFLRAEGPSTVKTPAEFPANHNNDPDPSPFPTSSEQKNRTKGRQAAPFQ
jgi:hypothetical protein